MNNEEGIYQKKKRIKQFLKINLKYGDASRIAKEFGFKYVDVHRCISPDFTKWDNQIIRAAKMVADKNIDEINSFL